VVAVKQLFVKTSQGLDEFLNEVVLITGMKHRNLVNLKGCCLREHQQLLVYEYVDNFDVDQILLGMFGLTTSSHFYLSFDIYFNSLKSSSQLLMAAINCCLHSIVFESPNNKFVCESRYLTNTTFVILFITTGTTTGTTRQVVSWAVRLKICLGIAHGLHYLHALAHPRVIHRDIKASNVLLDKNMEPKIADFGLALLFPDEQSHIMTVHVAGTK